MRWHVCAHVHGMGHGWWRSADVVRHVVHLVGHVAHLVVVALHVDVIHLRCGHVIHLVRTRDVHVVGHHGAHGCHRAVDRSTEIAHITGHVVGMGLRPVVAQGTIYIVQGRAVERTVGRYVAVDVDGTVGHVIRAGHAVHRRAKGTTHRTAHTVAHVVHRTAHRTAVHTAHGTSHRRWSTHLRVAHVAHVHVIVHGTGRADVGSHRAHASHAVVHRRHAPHRVVHVIAHR